MYETSVPQSVTITYSIPYSLVVVIPVRMNAVAWHSCFFYYTGNGGIGEEDPAIDLFSPMRYILAVLHVRPFTRERQPQRQHRASRMPGPDPALDPSLQKGVGPSACESPAACR